MDCKVVWAGNGNSPIMFHKSQLCIIPQSALLGSPLGVGEDFSREVFLDVEVDRSGRAAKWNKYGVA